MGGFSEHGQNEFLLRFRGELQEPVDHVSRIEENLDVERPKPSDDVIRDINSDWKYYRHELDEQFHKPEVNPFQRCPRKYTEDCTMH